MMSYVIAILYQHRKAMSAVFLTILVVVFTGMGATVITVVQGKPSDKALATKHRDEFSTVAPGIVLIACVLLLGVYIPSPVDALVRNAAASLEVMP